MIIKCNSVGLDCGMQLAPEGFAQLSFGYAGLFDMTANLCKAALAALEGVEP